MKENNLKSFKIIMIAVPIMMVMYFLFAIGDMAIKGSTDLTSTPIILGAIVLGGVIGLYIKEKKK